MLSFPSFPFIVFFLQVFWSKFAILFKFFLKKTNHFRTTPSTLFLSPVSLSSCYLRFLSLQIFPLLFSHFLSLLFFVFDIDRLALVLRLLSSNLSIMPSRKCLFSESSSPPRPVPFTSALVFDLYLFMKLVKWPLLKIFRNLANTSQLFAINGYILPYGSFFPTSTFTFKYTLARQFPHHMNVLFFIPRHDRPKEGRNKRLVYKLFKTWRRKPIYQE